MSNPLPRPAYSAQRTSAGDFFADRLFKREFLRRVRQGLRLKFAKALNEEIPCELRRLLTQLKSREIERQRQADFPGTF